MVAGPILQGKSGILTKNFEERVQFFGRLDLPSRSKIKYPNLNLSEQEKYLKKKREILGNMNQNTLNGNERHFEF